MDDPLAFFLTWTTYGTWLPGDERGWSRSQDSVGKRAGRGIWRPSDG